VIKKTSCHFNPYSLKLNINQNDGQNGGEKLDIFKCRDEQFLNDCDPYSCENFENFENSQNSVLDFDQSDGGDDQEGWDTLKELGEQQLSECQTYSKPNLEFLEPIKLSPGSDEFIREVERMFVEPTSDIVIFHYFFSTCLNSIINVDY